MNKIKLTALALLASCAVALTSCDDYLEVKLDDQMTIDEVFSKRSTTLSYLRHVYSYLPAEHEYQGALKVPYGGDGAVGTAMADESCFSWYQWVNHLKFRTGDNTPADNDYNIWANKYTGIEQAGIFMQNVVNCPELSSEEKAHCVAEARVVRAFCYFQLFRRFGPVFVWGDRRSDITIRPDEIDRNTVDENVDFMIEDLDKAIEDLPLEIADLNNYAGRITKGAAMALKARILLYAASPLYNGCDLYKGKMLNREGKYLFPQSTDASKWTKAAEAAKAVIDLNKYSLIQAEGTEMSDYIKAYTDLQNVAWNSEVIWGYWPGMVTISYGVACFNRQRMCPPNMGIPANGGYCASLKLVDSYAMAETGRYPGDPVKNLGYDSDGYPIVDAASGYQPGNDKINYENNFVYGWEHPNEGARFGGIKAHKSCVGREARYYASVLANGFKWVNEYIDGGNREVTFFTGGSSSYNPNDCVKSGFLWRRFLDNTIQYNVKDISWGQYFYWYFRLGEIYLDYAEACNEKPNRDAAEAIKYLNAIRNRVGLNNIEDAYPEYNFMSDQEALRQMIRRERMLELAFESHRYYDCRRWMTAVKEFTNPNWTLDVIATNYEASWQRTTRVWAGKDNLFTDKQYLFPINQTQLSEMKNITQNYGW